MKQYNHVKYIVLTLLFTACVHTADDIFDASPSQRLSEASQRYAQLLTAETRGWLMEYYPESTQKYGGFNLYFRFDGNNVTVRSEIDPHQSATSAWTITGATISFNTHNPVLHFFADPGMNQGGGLGLNYEGDFEFIVRQASETEFILTGKKTGNIIRMTPFTENSWEEYCSRLDETRYWIITPRYRMTAENRELSIERPLYNKFDITIDNQTISAPFILVPQGLKFYEPITILGQTFHEMTFNAHEEKLQTADGNWNITFDFIPLSEYICNIMPDANWFFQPDKIGQGLLHWWNAANDVEHVLLYSPELHSMYIGRHEHRYQFGITFDLYLNDLDVSYHGAFAYDIEPVGSDGIKFIYNRQFMQQAQNVDVLTSNAIYVAQNVPGFSAFAIDAFDGKTFKIVPTINIDNPRDMTQINEITLIDIENADNWVTIAYNR